MSSTYTEVYTTESEGRTAENRRRASSVTGASRVQTADGLSPRAAVELDSSSRAAPGGRLLSIPRVRGQTERSESRSRTTSGNVVVGEQRILRESVVETEITVPRSRIVEEVIEKTIIVPETVLREEISEENVTVRERIIEVARPVYQNKYVEVPEVEYRDKIIEVPERVIQEKVTQVPKVEIQEHVTYVPKQVIREKIVEVPRFEVREVVTEKIVEVPEFRDEVVINEVVVPRYVEVPVATLKDVEVEEDVQRALPIPLECLTSLDFKLPKIRSKHEIVPVPIYAPRFIEVAVPLEQLDEVRAATAEQLAVQVAMLAASGAPSLCEIEELADMAQNMRLDLEVDEVKMGLCWQAAARAQHEAGQQTISSQPRVAVEAK